MQYTVQWISRHLAAVRPLFLCFITSALYCYYFTLCPLFVPSRCGRPCDTTWSAGRQCARYAEATTAASRARTGSATPRHRRRNVVVASASRRPPLALATTASTTRGNGTATLLPPRSPSRTTSYDVGDSERHHSTGKLQTPKDSRVRGSSRGRRGIQVLACDSDVRGQRRARNVASVIAREQDNSNFALVDSGYESKLVLANLVFLVKPC